MEPEPIDFARAWAIIRRRGPLILLCIAVVAGAALAYSRSQPKEYTATASLVFDEDSLGSQIAGLTPSTAGAQFAKQASNTELVELGNMAATTARQLDRGLSEAEVRDSIEVSGQPESNIVAVSATSASPRLAAAIATAYAHQFVVQRRAENKDFFASALRLINGEIDRLPADQRFGPAAVALQNRAQNLRLLRGLGFSDVRVAQRATVPTEPSAPAVAKNTVVGALLGLLLGIGLAFLLERRDRERLLREPADLERAYGLPLLGAVPESPALAEAGAPNRRTADLQPADATAFELLRAHLRHSGPGGATGLVLVTAAERGAGTSTVARFLAEAAARLGSRALLVEADLRDPSIGLRLDLPPRPSLPDVLAGTASMREAIQSVPLGSTPGQGQARSLDVLACTPAPPPNPTELIESEAMATTLGYARSTYDLVVVDASPLTAFPDTYSILSRVDGVIVVSRVGRSTRELSRQLHRALAGSGARQLGVVANGAKLSELGAYAGGPVRDSASEVSEVPVAPASSNGPLRQTAPAPPLGG